MRSVAMKIELAVALETLHQRQLEDGDLGAAYRRSVFEYLKQAEAFRKPAEAGESGIEQIRKFVCA